METNGVSGNMRFILSSGVILGFLKRFGAHIRVKIWYDIIGSFRKKRSFYMILVNNCLGYG